MTVTTDLIANANKAAAEMLLGFAKIQFAAFERLLALNANATRAVFEAGIGRARTLQGDKGVQQLVSETSAAIQPNVDNVISYSHSVYELGTQTQGEIAKLVQSEAEEFNKNIVAFIEQVSKSAPGDPDVALAAFKSALATANAACERIAKVAKQATETAGANPVAATHVAKEARKKAA